MDGFPAEEEIVMLSGLSATPARSLSRAVDEASAAEDAAADAAAAAAAAAAARAAPSPLKLKPSRA